MTTLPAAIEILPGSLDLLILKTLSWDPMHGFGIARWLRTLTDDALQLEEGTLYPALYRMANKGWIASEWRITENNRRARYYSLTPKGKKHFTAQSASWLRFAGMMTQVLRAQTEPAT
jgi:PadR family transcriptional regulator, regulatory protein PadR